MVLAVEQVIENKMATLLGELGHPRILEYLESNIPEVIKRIKSKVSITPLKGQIEIDISDAIVREYKPRAKKRKEVNYAS